MLMIIPVISVTAQQNIQKTIINFISPIDQNITIVDFQYIPASITVSIGTKVIWTNNGPSLHTVTSDTNIFNSGNMGVGVKWNYTFNQAGSFPYHCALHPTMHGIVNVTSPNQPPNTPTQPVGPITRNVGQSGSYSTSATDPDGDQVQYRFDFDANGVHAYSSYTVLIPSGQTGSMSYTWNASGTFVVKAQARDSIGQTSNWSSGLTVTVSSGGNQPPNTPTVSGPSNVKVGVTQQFSAITTDPNSDMIEYFFDFGDGTNSGWTPSVNSGTAAQVSHSWAKRGTYIVKAKARDTSLAESAYGLLTISVPKEYSSTPVFPLLHLIWERLMYLFSLVEKNLYIL